jgi:hypothetical protein
MPAHFYVIPMKITMLLVGNPPAGGSGSFHPDIICFSMVGRNSHDEFSSVLLLNESWSFHIQEFDSVSE